MRQRNGCSTPAPRSSVAKQSTKEEPAQTKEEDHLKNELAYNQSKQSPESFQYGGFALWNLVKTPPIYCALKSVCGSLERCFRAKPLEALHPWRRDCDQCASLQSEKNYVIAVFTFNFYSSASFCFYTKYLNILCKLVNII